MRRVWLGAAAVLSWMAAASAEGAPVPGPARAITDPKSVVSEQKPGVGPAAIKDLFANRAAADAAWTPDGKALVISANFSGRFNLWRIPLDGAAPVQLTKSDDRQSGITISPDGKWVVFQSDHGGNEMYDLFAVPLAGGEVVNLTNTPATSETNPLFSPDGKVLAFAAKLKTSPISNVAVMDMGTHAVRALTKEPTLDNRWAPAAFTPDSKAVIANRGDVGSTNGSVWRLDVASGAAKRLDSDKVKARVAAADISRDGKLLSISSNQKGGIDQAALLDIKTGKLTWLQPGPWDQSASAFSPDGVSVLFTTDADGRQDISAYNLQSGKALKAPLPEGFNNAPDLGGSPFAKDGRLLVSHDASNTPFDYWVLDRAGKVTRVTRLAAPGWTPAMCRSRASSTTRAPTAR